MKIEPRGKYAGVKVHLEEDEVKNLLSGLPQKGSDQVGPGTFVVGTAVKFSHKLATKIRKLANENPNLLSPRTDEEIKAELILERDKAIEKLSLMEKGQKWNANSKGA